MLVLRRTCWRKACGKCEADKTGLENHWEHESKTIHDEKPSIPLPRLPNPAFRLARMFNNRIDRIDGKPSISVPIRMDLLRLSNIVAVAETSWVTEAAFWSSHQ